jgi:hypothetical protein
MDIGSIIELSDELEYVILNKKIVDNKIYLLLSTTSRPVKVLVAIQNGIFIIPVEDKEEAISYFK